MIIFDPVCVKPYVELSRYQQLSSDDTDLWTVFMRRYPDYFLEVQYDYAVSKPGCFGPFIPICGFQRKYTTSYSKRADVVARCTRGTYVIELKPSAGAHAYGQICVYLHCFRRMFADHVNVRGFIITDIMDCDALTLCTLHGILVCQLSLPLGQDFNLVDN